MAAEAGPPPADCFMTELSGLLDGAQVRVGLSLYLSAVKSFYGRVELGWIGYCRCRRREASRLDQQTTQNTCHEVTLVYSKCNVSM